MKRKWIAVAVVLSMMAVFTACSPKSAGSAGDQKEGASDQVEASQESASKAEKEDPGDEAAADVSVEIGPSVSFEAADLKGSPVSSAEIFSQNRLTMVNIWGTFCGPCIDEMPELERLNYRLRQKDCGIIGVVCDVQGPDDSATIGAAEEIIEEIGVKYLNLLPWSELDAQFPAQFIPTTYFVDSEGRIIGEAAVGARSADMYEDLIDAILAKME